MTGEVEFSSLTKDDVKMKLEQPDKVPRRPSDEQVAKYRKTRLVLVVFFGIVVVAMVVAAVIIIVVSPKCVKVEDGKAEKEDEPVDKEFWRHEVVYQIYPRSFKDSDKDGDGDLKGITEKLGYLKKLGVKIIRLNSIYGVKNFTVVNKMFGTVEDFEGLLKKAHELGMKVVLDFVPNHTSDKHPWFVESSGSPKNKKRDWYIWREGTKGGVNASGPNPPNNWLSINGGSAWERPNKTTLQFYLHQFNIDQPDLNLANPDVIQALKDALKFWLDKGIDGLALEKVQFMVEDSRFLNESLRDPTYNGSELLYNMLEHKYTHDLDQNLDIVKQFRGLMNTKSDDYQVLMAEVIGSINRTITYYEACDYPFNIGLLSDSKVPGMSLSQGINKSVSEYLKALPKGKQPNWLLGSHDTPRIGKEIIKAMNVLLLTLPGTASTYYGEEIGMVNGAVKNDSDPNDAERTPMQWTSDKNAGFTEGTPWLPVGNNVATVNVAEEEKINGSTYSLYKSLVELRSEEAFLSTDFEVVHVDEKLFAYTRGDRQYLVAINFGVAKWNEDFDELSVKLGEVVVDTENKEVGEKEDVNKIALNPGQAFVMKIL